MKHIYSNSSCKVFGGFYESNLYDSDTLYNFERDELPKGFCWEFKKDGYEKFCKETCEDWVDAMNDNFDENPLEMELKYIGMWSPKYYNYSTDKLNLEVKVNLAKLKKFCWKDNRDEFDEYLNKHWSSYDGFISFIPNNVREFEEEYRIRSDWKHDSLIDIMIEFYLLKYVNFDDVEMDCFENEYERLYNNITLQSEEDWSLWDFEYDNKTQSYIPTHKLEVD